MCISSRSETEVENKVASRHWSTLVNKPSKSGIRLEGQKSLVTYGYVVASKRCFRWKSGNITQMIAIDFTHLQVRKSTICTCQLVITSNMAYQTQTKELTKVE